MKRNNGFTLVELLAVIVILAIILAIAVPGISGVVRSSTKSAFEADAKLVLKAVEYKKLENNDFNPAILTQDNIEELLGLSTQNYTTLNVRVEDNVNIISVVGKGKWNGFVACGTYLNMRVVESLDDCSGDLIPPVITLLGSDPTNIFINGTYTDAGATATDNKDGDVTGNIVTTGSVNPNVPGSYTITYTVTDIAGNTATLSRTVNVVDNIAPTIVFNPESNTTYAKNRNITVTVEDDSNIKTNSLKYIWTMSTSQPVDDDFINVYTNGQSINTPTGASGTYYLWVMAEDMADNKTVVSSGAFNLDNVAPVITMNGSSPVSIAKGTAYSDAGASATDNIDAAVTVNSSGAVNVNVIGTYTITYTATDSSGNDATSVTRTINVVDTSAPVITILGSNPLTINLGSAYSDAGATATDDVDGNVTSNIVTTGTVNPNVEGTYTITYTVSDAAGNIATSTRTVNVVNPATPEVCFTFNTSTATITNYNASCGTNVIIPTKISNINVVNIGNSAFAEKGLTSVVIPSGVVTIDYYAFIRNSLTSVTIPNTVKTINNAAFNDNQLPDATAFIYGRKTDGSVDNTVLASYGGAKRSAVVIPSTVKTVGPEALSYIGLTSVTIPNGVLNIQWRAFSDNFLTSITIPNGVNAIGNSAFYNNNLTSVSIPGSVYLVDNCAFQNNDLTTVTLSSGLEIIGISAFADNVITSINIPSSVYWIDDAAFNNNRLSDSQAFIYARTYPSGIDTTTIVSYGGSRKSGVTIPNGVVTIDNNAFESVSLTSVTIPNTVTSINYFAFRYNSLNSIAIPNSVTFIGSYAIANNNIPQGSATIDNTSANVTIQLGGFYFNGTSGNTNITPVYLR